MLLLLKEFLHKLLEIFCPDFSLSHSFISSIIYVSSTHGYLCHTLSYNAKQLYLFCFGFGHWERFHLVPYPLIYPPHCFHLFDLIFFFFLFEYFLTFLLLGPRWPKFILRICSLLPIIGHFPRILEPGSFY